MLSPRGGARAEVAVVPRLTERGGLCPAATGLFEVADSRCIQAWQYPNRAVLEQGAWEIWGISDSRPQFGQDKGTNNTWSRPSASMAIFSPGVYIGHVNDLVSRGNESE